MHRRDHNIFFNAFSLLLCGLVTGLVVAAAVFPAAAMSGLTAKLGRETFASLPSELKEFRSPQITRIYASDNKTQISQFYDEFRSDVPLRDISKFMRDAMVALSADSRYTTWASGPHGRPSWVVLFVAPVTVDL